MSDDSIYIGNYCLVAGLASGAFGHVYLAQHVILQDRLVAIKLLHSMHLGSSEECIRFLKEAQFLEKLKHPHILPVIDVGLYEGFPYLVTEYASKGSLRDRLQSQPSHRLSVEESIPILMQIGQALQYAHEQNIVHRDLKPENILFNDAGEVLVADFGLATILGAESVKQTKVVGTIAYMAPEQFDEKVCRESDQYSLGCIAYELFTGHMPFVASTTAALITKRLLEQPIAPRKHNPQLPVYIEQAILKAMSKERAERFADISTFVAALRAFPTSPLHISAGPQRTLKSEPSKTKKELLDEGMAHLKAGNYTEALEFLNQLLAAESDNANIYLVKGAALEGLQRYQEALLVYDGAVRLEPSDVTAWCKKGNILFELKQYRQALESYERSIQLDSDFAEAYHGKGLVLKHFERYQGALNAFEQAIRLNPKYTSALCNRGDVLCNVRRYDEALASYEYTLQLDPQFAAAQLGKKLLLSTVIHPDASNMYGGKVKESDAVDELNDFSDCDEGLFNEYDDEVLEYPDDHEDDREIFNISKPFNSSSSCSADKYNEKGLILAQQQLYQEALQAYEQAIRLNPKYAPAWTNKGILLCALKQYAGALEAFERAIQLDPYNVSTYTNKGGVLINLSRYEESLDIYERALQLEPDNATTLYNKGLALYGLKRYQEAISACEQAIRLVPNFAGAYVIRGVASLFLNCYEEALVAFEQALQHSPNSATVWYYKSCALKYLGRSEEAERAYDRARQLGW